MSDDDQPTYVPLIKALVRKPASTPLLVRPYPGSGKSAYLKTLFMWHIAQKRFSPEVLEAIARAVANQGRPDRVTPFRPHLPIGKPPTVRDSFGRVLNRPSYELGNLSIGKLSRGRTTIRPTSS
jgi:hypothetical protein